MLNESMDRWQRSLSPVEGRWGCMKHLRAAAIRREIANEIPLYLASVIAAYCASEHEITRTSIGAVTAPIVTEYSKTIIQKEKDYDV